MKKSMVEYKTQCPETTLRVGSLKWERARTLRCIGVPVPPQNSHGCASHGLPTGRVTALPWLRWQLGKLGSNRPMRCSKLDLLKIHGDRNFILNTLVLHTLFVQRFPEGFLHHPWSKVLTHLSNWWYIWQLEAGRWYSAPHSNQTCFPVYCKDILFYVKE